MLAAVRLHDQHRLTAAEIHDVRAERKLPDEFEPAQSPVAQHGPETPLGLGLVATKIAGAWDVRSDRHYGPSPAVAALPLGTLSPRGERV